MLFASKLKLCNIFWPLFTKLVLFKTKRLFETALVLCMPATSNLGYSIFIELQMHLSVALANMLILG